MAMAWKQGGAGSGAVRSAASPAPLSRGIHSTGPPAASPSLPTQAASDIYSPVSGEVIAVNTELVDDPAKVGKACWQAAAREGGGAAATLGPLLHGALGRRRPLTGSLFPLSDFLLPAAVLPACPCTPLPFHPSIPRSPQINSEPFEGGWMVKLKLDDPTEADSLLDSEAYEKHVESEAH